MARSGSREAVAHAAVHGRLEVTRAVVRWRGSDCEDITKGVQAACRRMGRDAALVKWGEGERGWDIGHSWGPTGHLVPDREALKMLSAAMPP